MNQIKLLFDSSDEIPELARLLNTEIIKSNQFASLKKTNNINTIETKGRLQSRGRF